MPKSRTRKKPMHQHVMTKLSAQTKPTGFYDGAGKMPHMLTIEAPDYLRQEDSLLMKIFNSVTNDYVFEEESEIIQVLAENGAQIVSNDGNKLTITCETEHTALTLPCFFTKAFRDNPSSIAMIEGPTGNRPISLNLNSKNQNVSKDAINLTFYGSEASAELYPERDDWSIWPVFESLANEEPGDLSSALDRLEMAKTVIDAMEQYDFPCSTITFSPDSADKAEILLHKTMIANVSVTPPYGNFLELEDLAFIEPMPDICESLITEQTVAWCWTSEFYQIYVEQQKSDHDDDIFNSPAKAWLFFQGTPANAVPNTEEVRLEALRLFEKDSAGINNADEAARVLSRFRYGGVANMPEHIPVLIDKRVNQVIAMFIDDLI